MILLILSIVDLIFSDYSRRAPGAIAVAMIRTGIMGMIQTAG